MDCYRAAGKVYNVGSAEEITIESLADKIIEMTGSKSLKKYICYEEAYGVPIEDMMRRVPSLERIKKKYRLGAPNELDRDLGGDHRKFQVLTVHYSWLMQVPIYEVEHYEKGIDNRHYRPRRLISCGTIIGQGLSGLGCSSA
jgi:hypothetical protein